MARLSEFRENPDNPSVATDEEIARLAGKLKRVPLGLVAMRIAYVTDAHGGGKMVISGNKRLRCLKAAYGENGEVPDDWFADVTAMSEAERHEFILDANISDGHWDLERLLAQYGETELVDAMGADAIAKLLADTHADDADAKVNHADNPPALDDLQLDARMDAAKYVFFSFSGGRDSTRALYLSAPKFLASGKRCEAVYVGSACEFPDVECHIRRVCADMGLPLKILRPDKTFITEYAEKHQCPDPIFMDCIEYLINAPMDAYCKEVCGDDDYILVRGGQPKQKTARSRTNGVQNPKGKLHLLIYNPLFYATEEQLNAPIPEWQGYAAGFVRTACWCCPFQREAQYLALKVNYPFLYEEMKKMVSTMKFPIHNGDGHVKYFQYWEEAEGITLHKEMY